MYQYDGFHDDDDEEDYRDLCDLEKEEEDGFICCGRCMDCLGLSESDF